MKIFMVILCCCLLIGCTIMPDDEKWLKERNYNVNDVYVFLQSIGKTGYDFQISPSLRKQYEVFQNGGNSEFLTQAKAKKEADSARTSGMVMGLVIGSSIKSGGR